MEQHISLDQLDQEIVFFKKMYDVVRIVDPLAKKVLEMKENTVGESDIVCYNYWKTGKICDNCISIRAFRDNKTYMKIEQSGDSILLVTSIPVQTKERPVVLELLNNVTETMMMGNGDYNENTSMHQIIRQMNDLIVKDSLTSLYNRRYVEERLPADIVRSTIEKSMLSVIFMDMDNLKEVNDQFGHLIGDQVLIEIGKIINANLNQEMDWAARFGGDEFIISIRSCDETATYLIAETIKLGIEQIEIPQTEQAFRITTSIGIHSVKRVLLTHEELIQSADRNMYQAKLLGKNCIVHSVDEEVSWR